MSALEPILAEAESEAAALRRCLRDLIALSTLPAVWTHADALGSMESLAEVMLRMLGLELVYLRVPHGGERLEAGRTAARPTAAGRGADLGRRLEAQFSLEALEPPRSIGALDGGGRLALAVVPIGHYRDGGFIVAAARREDFPGEQDRLLLGVGANQLALMLQRKSAEAQLRDEAATLETLNRVGQTLAAQLDLERLLQQVTNAATALTGAQFGAFFYNKVDEDGESYQLFTLAGAPRAAFEKFPMPRNTAVFAPTFAGTGVLRSEDIRKDPRYGKNAPRRGPPEGHLPVVSYLAVPVVSRSKEVLGGLFFGHAQPGVFTERAERLAVGIAAQAAIAIDNARLYEALRKSAQRLAESDQRKDEFLATLAHELRNPLAPMRSALKLLEIAPRRADLGVEAQAMLGRQLEHLVRLVDDLLDVSRISLGKIELRRSRTELADAVRSALETVRPLIEQAGQALAVELPAGPAPLDADPVRLAQVFSNLLNNASKYTGRGGRIALLAQRRGGEIEVAVRDNGIGIPPEMLPRVFDLFTQVDASLEKAHGGLGIGLTIVKRLVELHGGMIEARSEGLGRGSEFVVRLPLASAAAEHEPAAGARDAEPAARPRRILVVDDNVDAATSLAMLLEALGNEASTAADGPAALAALEASRADLVLLDIGMPGMNGFEVCERIRARPWGREPTLVALSGWGQEEHRARARAAGFDHYLVKPVDPEALRLLLAALPGSR